MPIRFRKSIKIAPGTRLNISKKGVSASVGAGGLRASTGKSGNCLYNIFVLPFVLIFQLYGLLFKGIIWLWKKATATPQTRRASLIVIGVLSVIGFCTSAVSAFTGSVAAQPTQDTSKIRSLALTSAWIAQTQTAISLPTLTSLPSLTPTETLTASPVPTITDTAIPLPTLTPTSLPTLTLAPYVPPQPNYPANITAVCKDGSYSYSKTASGTCSGHGGVNIWVNHP